MGISYLISLNLPILPCAALGVLIARSPVYCIFTVKSQASRCQNSLLPLTWIFGSIDEDSVDLSM